MVIHLDERSFKCYVCEMTFKRNDSLLVHKDVVHTDNKKFVWECCGYRCSHSYKLNQHRKKTFECDKCENKFSCNSGFKTHKSEAHTENYGTATLDIDNGEIIKRKHRCKDTFAIVTFVKREFTFEIIWRGI